MITMRYTLLILTTALLFLSCKKENTVWETDWSIPVINDTLSLINLVNDSTLTESSGFYNVDLNRTLFDINVNELVEIPDTVISGAYSTPFSTFVVNPGIPFITEEQELELVMNDIQLKEILVKQGTIDVTISNPVGTKALFNIVLPGVSKNGIVFSETYEVNLGSNANPSIAENTVDLSGYTIDLTGIAGNKRNSFRTLVTVTADPNGTSVIMTNTDSVYVDVRLNGLQIDYARGYFGNQVISDTTDIDFGILDMIQSGAIDLPATTVKFEVENGIKVGASALLSFIKNENSLGTIVSLSHPQLGSAFNIDPATGSWASLSPSQKLLVFDDANSNVKAFLENLGAKNSVGYRIEMNPWGNVSGGTDEIFPQSRLKVNLHVNMPLKLGTDALVVRDTFEVDLSQNTSSTHVLSGEMLLSTSNAFPFSADVKLYLVNSSGTIIHTISGTQKIQASQFGSLQASTNLMVADSDVKIILSEEVVANIGDVKSIIIESQFDSTNPSNGVNEQMSIPVGAFLAVKLRTRFTTQNQF